MELYIALPTAFLISVIIVSLLHLVCKNVKDPAEVHND